ncbi:rRNA maturation RNase YbeY [Accumulibacter sp.]|uniref:rRNA maturation RNase YbeY n=1 Tax=Accumulibacter sp. TaxID=2053492 RepID=UPI002624CE05|nr:rRNA maturation RNase YbeY [Accumulibacter sp.]
MSATKRLQLSVQYACPRNKLPKKSQLRAWLRAAIDVDGRCRAAVTLRFVDADEGRRLNHDYRRQDYATNVLSFPYTRQPIVSGDLVLCAPVVAREAAEQGKSLEAHYAHLVVHGLLHLLGDDHEASVEQASAMEDRERRILAALGYPDPYAAES